MRKRSTVKERFTTFIEWKSNGSWIWQEDRKLCNIFDKCLEQNPDFDEIDLVNFWLGDWKSKFASSQKDRNDSENNEIYAFSHPLAAYLQESLLIAAKDRYRKYSGFKSFTAQDYFQIGFVLLCKGKIIRNNEFDYSKFKSYAILQFKSRINDELRTQNRYIARTPESLVLEQDKKIEKESEKTNKARDNKISSTEARLREALKWRGIESELLEEYIKVWSVYREIRRQNRKIYQGKILPLAYNSNEWEIIYQEVKHCYSDLALGIETIKERMEECSQALSDYLSPKSISLNNLVGDADDSLEYLDNLVYKNRYVDQSKFKETNLYSIIFDNLVDWSAKEILLLEEEIIANRRIRLIPKFKLILDLYYGLQMEQALVANHLNSHYPEVAEQIAINGIVRQYHIARLVSKIIKTTTKKSIKHFENSEFLLQSGVKITFDDFKVSYLEEYINHSNELFNLVFRAYYNSTDWQLYNWLKSKIKDFSEDEKRFLELYYVQSVEIYESEAEKAYSTFGVEFTDISSYLNRTIDQIKELESNIKVGIVDDFNQFANDSNSLDIRWSEKERDLTLNLSDKWLRTYCDKYTIFNAN